jgi:hypothetical protein
MKNLKVTFYTNGFMNGSGKSTKFDCIFKTDKELQKFLDEYEHFGGLTQFNYDVWNDNCKEKLPVLTNSFRSYEQLHEALLPAIEFSTP